MKTIYKDKKNWLENWELGRRVDTIIDTIRIYYEMIGKKFCVVREEQRKKEGYDFYIYRGNEIFKENEYNLFITNNKISYENYEYIEDSYTKPENFEIIDVSELEYYEKIFNKKLPIKGKIKVIEDIKNNIKVFATEDIKIIL